MGETKTLDGITYAKMLRAGAAKLNEHVQEINNLNVFPIPDGDTGDNMFLTLLGGTDALKDAPADLGAASKMAADGMLLSARGNSGVILSQIFAGIAKGFEGIQQADLFAVGKALKSGIKCAYSAVMEPTEGTILTVYREAAEYACVCAGGSMEEMLSGFIEKGRKTLEKTPEMLCVLKKAGVVDSGGAGLLYIAEGMKKGLGGEPEGTAPGAFIPHSMNLDLDLFREDSVLEFGYCTECLLRLQSSKTDPESFDTDIITDYLKSIGNSVVCVKTGSIVKLHVHTMVPGEVMNFCQKYGEFLKVKVENMSLQHSDSVHANADALPQKLVPEKHKRYGIVEVASGEGIKKAFAERGADFVIDGGAGMNPSTQDFLEAFGRILADVIFVFPNDPNVIMAARQAADFYKGADVKVIESRSVGEGYMALLMFDDGPKDEKEVLENIYSSMEGVATARISRCIRNVSGAGRDIRAGEYIGFVSDEILSAAESRSEAAKDLIEQLGAKDYDVAIIFYGKDANEEEAGEIKQALLKANRYMEVYTIFGGQDIYDEIIILQ